MILGFLLAYLLNTDLWGRGIFQTILIVPMMVMPVMVGIAWLAILHPVYGMLNYLTGLLHLPEIGWMTDPNVVVVTVAITEVWRNTPMVMLILLAGLRSMPGEISDAAKVDGATGIQFVSHVVLGWIRPFVMFSLLIMTMFELRTFDTVFALFHSGGPGQGAQVLGVYLFERFTNSYDFGKSSAVAYLLLLLTMVFSVWFARGAVRGVEE
jgi:ABC-type sugar transport system permease subunit